ncbi:MAG: nucleoside phosphorylase [Caldilineaceae bacterium]
MTMQPIRAHEFPILEYDPTVDAIIDIDLEQDRHPQMPEHCVICFFRDVIDHFLEAGLLTRLHTVKSEMLEHPVYLYQIGDQKVALLHQAVGAPLAVYLLEECIGMGARKFIACGGAGVLDRSIAMGHLLVPTAAVRDEGTSYHYLPPSREVTPSMAAVQAIETVLQRHKIDYLLTKTWTTDAIFRETRAKVAMRRAEGCLAVEMEAASMFAVAQFRNVTLGQILYGGDNLDGDEWDGRDWMSNWSVREKLIQLAAEACLEL